jgi:heat shock protein HtpX
MVAVGFRAPVRKPIPRQCVDLVAIPVVLLLLPLWDRDGVLGAVPLGAADAPELHGSVARLCALADIPAPELALLDVPYSNAFTVARSPRDNTLVVTQGLLDRLDAPEVEAVLAHELAHLAHRDAFVMTVVSEPARALRSVVPALARPLRVPGLWLLLAFLVRVVILAWCADVIATMLVLTLSRYRELLADRGAALLTGRPEALMSALQKISGRLASIPAADLREAAAWNPFFVLPTERTPGVFELDPFVLFPTHPPLERRLERLAAMERTARPIEVEASSRPANPRAGLALRLAFVTWPLAWGAYLFGGGAPVVSLLAMGTWILSFAFAVQAIAAAQRGTTGGRLAAASLVVLAAPVLVTIVLGSALALAGG